MKKLVIAVSLLLLTACSPSSSFVQGEVCHANQFLKIQPLLVELKWIVLIAARVLS
jgi:uncharacterized lipoprotein YajG